MLKIAWRYTIRNKKRTFVSIVGIAFSVMLMFSLIQMGDCIMAQFTSMATTGMKRDFTVADVSYKQLKKAKQILKDAGLEDNYMLTMNVASWYEDDYAVTNVIGVEGNLGYFKDTGIVAGNYPKKNYEICVEEVFNEAREEPYKVGDTVSVVLENDTTSETVEVEFVVSGIIKNISDDGKRVWVNLETANEIKKKIGNKNNVDNAIAIVAEKDTYNLDKSLEIATLLKDELHLENFYTEHYMENESKTSLFTEEESSYHSMSDTLKGITILLGICMKIFVFNTYHMSAIGKLNQLATMRCIGLNKKQQNKILLYEGVVIGNLGILLGFVGGNILNYTIAEKIMGYLMGLDGIKITQTFISYVETYFLAIIAIFIAMGKVIFDIHKCTILEALHYTEENKGKFEEKTGNRKEKERKNKKKFMSPLVQIAKRNLQRNPSKSNILLVTMTISILLCIVVLSAFFSIDIKNNQWSKSELFGYEIYSKDVLREELTEELWKNVVQLVGVENVYGEFLVREIQSENIQEKEVITVVYDDALFGLLLNSMGIKEWNYTEEPYALLYSEKQTEITNIKVKNSMTSQSYDIEIAKSFYMGENYIVHNYYGYDLNYLILNQTMAEQIGVNRLGYTGLLIKENPHITALELQNCSNQEGVIYVENLNKNSERAKEQFLAMVYIAGYIMLATISLTCIIVSSTLQANIINRKKELAIMSAIGLTKRKNIFVCCIESFLVFGKAYLMGAVIGTGLNFIVGGMLEDGMRWNLFIYIGVAIFFFIVTIGTTMLHMKQQLKISISEMLKDE